MQKTHRNIKADVLFASSPHLVREVKDTGANFKSVLERCFTLLMFSF